MAQKNLTEKTAALAAPLARSLGLALWGVELLHSGRFGVRVFVENADGGDPDARDADTENSAQGVNIDQCAELSRLLGLALDAEDILPGPYVLEVSSPGMDRIFFDAGQLDKAVGHIVELSLRDPAPAFPDRRNFRGTLGKEDGLFVLRFKNEEAPETDAELPFAFAEAAKVRLVPLFPEKKLPGRGGKKKKCGGSQ
ncbi:MAG: ribosome maturation factor [Desulfovibrio sp.]|nr:ribosome maturation factor [Desulfovibrio sp.]